MALTCEEFFKRKAKEEEKARLEAEKLALLEKNLIEREEAARMEGYTTSPIDTAFREKVTQLMDKVRVI